MGHARWAMAGVVVAVLLGGLSTAQCVWADDESDEVEIKLRAPLTAIDCGTGMISILGLPIDIGHAALRADDEDGALDCAALVPLVGQTVKVELLSDDVPLIATEVKVGGGDEDDDEVGEGGDVELTAPLQQVVVDATTHTTTVTVLGLTIDVTNADIEGADDDGHDGEEQPVDLTTLPLRTFVEIRLDAALLPMLVATELEVKNFNNHVDVEVVGPNGEEIDDRDEAGDPVNDVDVRVAETVKVRPAGRRHGRRATRVLHFHTRTNGSVVLSGLPTGHGRVSVTRVVNGSTMTGQGRVVVGPNTTRHRRIVLHHAG
jgi:hypothetical protein